LYEDGERLSKQPALAAVGTKSKVYAGEVEEKFLPGVRRFRWIGCWFAFEGFRPFVLEESPGNFQLGSYVAGGHEPAMPYFGEACRQDVKEKSPDELFCGYGDKPFVPGFLVVPGEEGDRSVDHAYQALVGYGNPVGVSTQVGEDVFRLCKRLS